ncbi:hypothetical protein [Baia soyae]|uniref:Uncharacterized protein n=1 Tax=Baia soyae TaxID=1544746 RepID=A0A4R2RGK9_9BACL|nr:hypothetical protein [Baia soyae]TCP62083.1 hypothetical protein EDD57_15712 [Baia soyae]
MTGKRTDEQVEKLLAEDLASQAIEGIELTGEEKNSLGYVCVAISQNWNF